MSQGLAFRAEIVVTGELSDGRDITLADFHRYVFENYPAIKFVNRFFDKEGIPVALIFTLK